MPVRIAEIDELRAAVLSGHKKGLAKRARGDVPPIARAGGSGWEVAVSDVTVGDVAQRPLLWKRHDARPVSHDRKTWVGEVVLSFPQTQHFRRTAKTTPVSLEPILAKLNSP